MPYYQRSWNKVLGYDAPPQNVKLRTIPLVDSVDLMAQGVTPERALSKEPTEQQLPIVTRPVVTSFREELTKQVDKWRAAKCSEPVTKSAHWRDFTVHKDSVIFKGTFSSIFACTSRVHTQVAFICRIFKPTALLNPDDDFYLRILNHIGKEHPFVVATWGVFSDDKRNILLVQEYANKGNSIDYVRAGNKASEEQMCRWAQNIYEAMDYLGSKAIAHRAIYPKHFMLTTIASGETVAKLSGFRDAIVYWDPGTDTVIPQPCKLMTDACSFHAPEMFGSIGGDEYFDPVDADIWSYGCSMYFLVAGLYKFRVNDPTLENEIRNAIAELNVSDACKFWIFGLMRVNTADRTDFDAIDKDPWFRSF